MGFFKRLFGDRPPIDDGVYLYIRLARRGEVVRLRLNPQSDLNPDYQRGLLVSRKDIIGPRTFERAFAQFTFNHSLELVEHEIDGGELASLEDWESQQPPHGSEEDAR